jgi:hypothetical protein
VSFPLLAAVAYSLLQTDMGRIEEALAAGDYHDAWARAEEAPAALARWRARTEILYRAGDPAGALAAARAGLALEPAHLELLHRAASSALWLEEATSAREFTERLHRAVEGSTDLEPVEREPWEAAALAFTARTAALLQHEHERTRASTWSRALSLGVLASVLLLVAREVRRVYGRSSSPDS